MSEDISYMEYNLDDQRLKEFLRIKKEILDLSIFMIEHLDDYANYNFRQFQIDILKIQSNLSSLWNISKQGEIKEIMSITKLADDLIGEGMKAVSDSENVIDYAYNVGYLAGRVSVYLIKVNSILMRL